MSDGLRSFLWRYGTSVCLYLIAFLLTDGLWRFLQPAPVPLFFAAILAAFWGGFGPGLFISIVSALTIDFFFVPPYDHFEWTPQNVVRIGVFITVSSLISWLNSSRKRLIDERSRLLVQVEGFNRDLRHDVMVATEKLADANEALLASQRVLARSERMAIVGQMAASLAHEIGSPLHAISGHLELLGDYVPADTESGRRITIIRQQLGVIVATVKRLLEWTHKRNLECDFASVPELIDEVLWLVAPTLKRHSITAEVDTIEELPKLNVDRKRLQHVFLNLINNSIEAMPNGGRIDVIIRCSKSARMEITFQDSGSGIEPSAIQYLFEPMWTTKSSGSGFGLAIAREIVNQHGGEIQVLSSENGAGFLITLPFMTATMTEHKEKAVGL